MATTFMKHAGQFKRTFDQKLEPPVRQHLKQVYSTLALATFAAGCGSYLHLFTNIMSGGFMAAIGALVCGLMLTITQDDGKNTQKRLGYLLGFAGCTGLTLGPLLEMAIYLNPKIVPFSIMSTCLVFGSFTMSAIFSNHGKWLYMGGGLLSMLSIMMFTSLINLFIGSYFLFQAQLYVGLVVFCLFVMYDTACIIERRRLGDTDYIKHAMFLFVDAVDIFRTLVVILTQKERNERNNRNRR